MKVKLMNPNWTNSQSPPTMREVSRVSNQGSNIPAMLNEADRNMVDWLLKGDSAIRWQVMRDLSRVSPDEWKAERKKVGHSGWGARLLELRDQGGTWGGGLYSPKWTSTTYTLLELVNMGVRADHLECREGAEVLLTGMLGEIDSPGFQASLKRCDQCVVGLLLKIAAYFNPQDPRLLPMAECLLDVQLSDGGWNCRSARVRVHHSSFHTTFNVLEGLQTYAESCEAFRERLSVATEHATELMLEHRLFRSDKTGDVIHPTFTMLSFPSRWHYDFLRGLDFFQRINAKRDPRFLDAIELLQEKRRRDGTWPVQHKHAGKVFFDFEKIGGKSRWNTLRALRVLKWWTS
jgi:hypothetical protein